MKDLISSPEYQKWLLQNHHRVKVEEVGNMSRQLDFDSGDDDD